MPSEYRALIWTPTGEVPLHFGSQTCKESVTSSDQETMNTMNLLSKPERVISWACRIIAAVILLQTLYFKFSAAPESVYIFTTLGMEPWGRIGSGIAELIAAVLLFVPRRPWIGAALALGVIGGAIMSHLTVLGIVVMEDGGLLFSLALVVAACATAVLFVHRRALPIVGRRF